MRQLAKLTSAVAQLLQLQPVISAYDFQIIKEPAYP
jgi:hypothetical protein